MKTIGVILAAMGLASAGVIPVAPQVGNVVYQVQSDIGQVQGVQLVQSGIDGFNGADFAYADGNGLAQNAAYFVDPVSGFKVATTSQTAGPAVVIPPAVAPAFFPASSDVVVPAPSETELPSAVVQGEVASAPVDSELPAPVVTKTEEGTAAPETESTPAIEESKPEDSEVSQPAQEIAPPAFDLRQQIIPVHVTPEVQAAKAAHLAAFEEVKLRDMEQSAQEAQENLVNSDSDKQPQEPLDSTDAPATESSPSAEPSIAPKTPLPASAQIPSKAEIITPSVVATELAPADSPVEFRQGLVSPVASPSPVDIVPAVLTRQVVAAPAQAPTTIVSAPAATIPFFVVNAPVAPSPSGPVALEHVGQITSQYHAQDEYGQYIYGYSGGPSAKHEVKTADGLTNGGYSYIDSHGLVQTAAYVSDPVNGFRVVATNIPQNRQPEYIPDSPEVEEAKQKLFQAQAEHIAKL